VSNFAQTAAGSRRSLYVVALLFRARPEPSRQQKEHTMNRRTALAVGTTALLSLGIALSNAALAQQKPLKEQLVGTWLISSWEQDVPNSQKLHRFGDNPKGYNVFDANGRFFVMLARPDLPKIAANDPNKPTSEEAKAIAVGSIAYYGTYTVDDATKVITMRIESSTYPNQLGMDQKRTVNFISANELKMQNTTVVGGGGEIRYTYKRATTVASN
jgi:hypothetical protein